MAFRGSAGKTSRIVALEFGPSTLRFVEMIPGGHPANRVVSAGVVDLEAGADAATHADRIRAVLARTTAPQTGAATVVACVPLRHAFLRLIDVPEGTDDVPAALRWDMAQYLARPLDRYALDFLPLEAPESGAQGAQRYLAGAYRLREVETLRDALGEAGAPAPAALDIDALAVLDALAVNYPECLPERTLVIKADAEATLLFRTQNGEYLGGAVQRENPDAPYAALEGPERREHFMHRARLIALGVGAASGDWIEPERIFLCGDLSGDADFREILKSGMQAPFALLNPFRKVPGPDPELHRGAYPGAPFAATVGLALRAAAAHSGSPQPRLNLLRHLPSAGFAGEREEARPPRPTRETARSPFKRVLIAAALLLLVLAAGFALRNPEWIRGRVRIAATPRAPSADSLRQALESEASRVVAGQQRAAIAWLTDLETAVLADSLGIRITRSVFNAPDRFVLQGLAKNEEAMSRLQESLVLIPGIDLRRSESRATPTAQEFLFSGAFAAPVEDGLDSVKISNRVTSKAEIETAFGRFLDAATATGVPFERLTAATPTTSGSFEARPFRLAARLGDAGNTAVAARLRAFLETEFTHDSPFGIQRVSLERVNFSSDSQTVFLDIMAFCR